MLISQIRSLGSFVVRNYNQLWFSFLFIQQFSIQLPILPSFYQFHWVGFFVFARSPSFSSSLSFCSCKKQIHQYNVRKQFSTKVAFACSTITINYTYCIRLCIEFIQNRYTQKKKESRGTLLCFVHTQHIANINSFVMIERTRERVIEKEIKIH